MASTTTTNASNKKNKLTLRVSKDDADRLDALRERRKLRVAQADGLGPPDRMSRSALALHYLRLGMTQAERAAQVTLQTTLSADEDQTSGPRGS